MLKRIKGIMFHPKTEWDAVVGEKPGAAVLLRNFLLPLSLFAPLATIIGVAMFCMMVLSSVMGGVASALGIL